MQGGGTGCRADSDLNGEGRDHKYTYIHNLFLTSTSVQCRAAWLFKSIVSY